MKAISLRIRMQTLSPCLTPSFCNPPAMRSARSATSAWLRRRGPLMTPRKSCCVDILSFWSLVGFKDSSRHSGAMQSIEPGISRFRVRVFDPPRNDGERFSNIREARRALVDIGTDRLKLIGPAHQFHLLDGFGQQCRAGIDGKIVQHALGGADRLGALACDLARDL